jgi:autotransporter-associated beta strand protein
LGGNVILNTTGGTNANVTIPQVSQTLAIDLGSVQRTFDIASGRTFSIMFGNRFTGTGGGILKIGSGTLSNDATGTDFTGQLTIQDGVYQTGQSLNNISAAGVLGNSALPVILGGSGTTGTLRSTRGNTSGSTTKTFKLADGGTGAIDLTASDFTLTISGAITGDTLNTGNFEKTGAGTLILTTATNTYGGTTKATGGILTLEKAASLSGYNSSGKVIFNGGTLAVRIGGSGWSDTNLNDLLSNATKTSGYLGIDTANGTFTQVTALTASNLGTGIGLRKLGSNTFIMGQTNTYTTPTLVSAGVLRANDNTGLPGALSAGNGSNLNINGGIFETGANLERAGGTGQAEMQITGGTSGFSSNTAGVQIAFGTLTSPTALTWGTAPFAPGTFVLNGSTATNTLEFKNPISFANSARTVQVDATAAGTAVTMSGVLSSSGASGGLTKTGSGTLVLSGANTYTGNTQINQTNNLGTIRIGIDSDGVVGTINSSAIGKGTLIFNGGGLSSDGTAVRTILNPVTFNGNGTIGDATNNGKLTFGANVNLNGAVRSVAVSSDVEINGQLTSTSGGLTKTGTAKLTVTGNNTNTGATSVANGILEVGNGGAGASINSTSGVSVSPFGTLAFNHSDPQTVSKPISGSGAITKSGSGTLTLSGANTFAGTMTVNGGAIAGSTGSLSGTIALTNNTSVTFDQASDGTYRRSISGAGNLVKQGTAALLLDGAQAYDGSTTIAGGTIKLTTPTITTVPSGLSEGNQYRLMFVTTAEAYGRWSADNNSGFSTIAQYNTFAANSANSVPALAALGTTWTAVVATETPPPGGGTFANARTNTGTTGTGGVPFYNLNNQQLAANNGDLWDGTIAVPVNYTELGVISALQYNSQQMVWTGVSDATTGVGNNDNSLISPSGGYIHAGLANSATSSWITTLGSGDPNLRTNDLMPIYVMSGVLTVPASSSVANLLPATTTVNIGASGTLDLNGINQQVVGLADSGGGGGSVTNNHASQAVTLTLNPTGGSNAFSGVIGGGTSAISLVKQGAGTQVLSGVNTYTGTTTVNQGTLLVNSPGSLAAGSAVTVNATGTLGGTGTINGTVAIQSGGTVAPGASAGTLNLANGLTVDAGATYDWEHTAGNALGTAGSTFDTLNVTAGTVSISNAINIGSKLRLLYAAGTDFADAFWNSGRTWGIITGNVTAGNYFDTSNLSVLVNGSPVDGGDYSITGEGAFATTVSGGNLNLTWTPAVSTPQWIGGTGGNAWNVAANWSTNSVPGGAGAGVEFGGAGSSGAADLAASNRIVGAVTFKSNVSTTITGASNSIELNNSGSTASIAVDGGTHAISSGVQLVDNASITVSAGQLTVGGVISQSAAGRTLSVNGSGILTLSGANTFSGATTLAGGTLQIGVDSVGSVGLITSSAVGTGGLTLSGGTLSSSGTSARTILNPLTITGNVTLGHATNNGALTFAANADLNGGNRTVTLDSDAQFDGVVSNGGLIKAGAGTLTLTNSNIHAGGTTLNAGRTRIGANTALGSGTLTLGNGSLSSTDTNPRTLANAVTVSGDPTIGHATNNGKLTFTGNVDLGGATRTVTAASDAQLDGIVSGTGGLTKAGSGTLTLTGANIFAGATAVNAGKLVGNTASLPTTITLANNSNVTFDQGTPATYGKAIGGTGSLTKDGVGTLTLSAQHNYAGDTVISNGTLQLQVSAPGLQPAGLLPGDQYRLVFVTSGTWQDPQTPGGLDIATVNGRVNTAANAVGSVVAVLGADWKAIASVLNTNANANTLTRTSDPSYPIYNLAGQRVAAGNSSLWGDNVNIENPISVNELGNTVTARVWTGTNSDTGQRGGDWFLGDTGGGWRYFGWTNQTGHRDATDGTRWASNLGEQWNMSFAHYGISGVLTASSTTILPTTTNVKIASGATLDLGGVSQPVGSLADSGVGSGFIINSVANTATLTVSPASGSTTFSGVIGGGSGAIALLKTGAGTQVLSGANTYTGSTTVSNGTLTLAHASNNNIASSPTITVASGAVLNVSGLDGGAGLTLAGGQTLKGAGTVTGGLTVGGGSVLSPGASIGTLTVNGNLSLTGGEANFETAATGVNDKVVGVSALSYGGWLKITASDLTLGNSWDLFDFDSQTNFFNNTFGTAGDGTYLPILTGGNTWSFNYGSGVLSIAAPPSVPAGSGIWMNGTGDGKWSTNTTVGNNWTDGQPGGVRHVATFDWSVTNYGTGAVNVDGPRTVGKLILDRAAGGYTFSGSALTLDNTDGMTNAKIQALVGTHTLNSQVVTADKLDVEVTGGAGLHLNGGIDNTAAKALLLSNASGTLDTGNIANNGAMTVAGTVGVGAVTGSGSTAVDLFASLTANSIVQDTLTIGAGGSVTIREIPVAGGAAGANAVPEPGTWALIATALVGLLALRRRR